MFPFPRAPSVPSIQPYNSQVSLASNYSSSVASNHSPSVVSRHSKTLANTTLAEQKRPRTISEGPFDARRVFRYDTIEDEDKHINDSQSLTLQSNLRNSPIFRTIAKGNRIRSVSDAVSDSTEGLSETRIASNSPLQALRHVAIPIIGGNDKASEQAIDLASERSGAELMERIKLKGMIDDIYKNFEAIDEEGIRALKESICENLISRGTSPEKLQSTLNDLQKSDQWLSLIKGFLSAFGFIAGGRIGELVIPMLAPLMPTFLLALMPGLIITGADGFFASVLNDTTPDYFTAPDPALMAEVMQKCRQHYERPLSKEMAVQIFCLFYPYTIRNLACSLISPIAAYHGRPEIVQLSSDLLAPWAGVKVQGLRDNNDRDDHLMHMAYFFAQSNWPHQLTELQSPTHQKIIRLFNRTFKGVGDIPTMLGNAFSSYFTLVRLTEAFVLSFGFAGINAAIKKIQNLFQDDSRPPPAYLASAASTASLMVLYALFAAAMVCSDRMTRRLATVQPCPEAPPPPSPISIRSLNNVQRY